MSLEKLSAAGFQEAAPSCSLSSMYLARPSKLKSRLQKRKLTQLLSKEMLVDVQSLEVSEMSE